MSREPTFGKEKIQEQFQDLADSIDKPTTVYLIGGGAMTLSEQKTSTKDIDLVVESSEDYQRVKRSLMEFGYKPQQDLTNAYENIGAKVVLEKNDRRFDIFDREVAGELQLSDSIKRRTESVLNFQDLEVRRYSDEDIFLFKAVTDRTDDIDDMATLLAGGLDFDVVEKEVENQRDLVKDDLFITYIAESLQHLEEKHGITTDLTSYIEPLAEKVHHQVDILLLLEEKEEISVHQISEELEHPQQNIKEALNRLEEMNKIEIESEIVRSTKET